METTGWGVFPDFYGRGVRCRGLGAVKQQPGRDGTGYRELFKIVFFFFLLKVILFQFEPSAFPYPQSVSSAL